MNTNDENHLFEYEIRSWMISNVSNKKSIIPPSLYSLQKRTKFHTWNEPFTKMWPIYKKKNSAKINCKKKKLFQKKTHCQIIFYSFGVLSAIVMYALSDDGLIWVDVSMNRASPTKLFHSLQQCRFSKWCGEKSILSYVWCACVSFVALWHETLIKCLAYERCFFEWLCVR